MITSLENFLRRFTELPFLLDYLHTEELSLPSPSTWDDRNDAYYLDLYRAKRKCEGVYALCMTRSTETYHHWKVFSAGASAVCIEFKRKDFQDRLKLHKTVRFGDIQYRTLADIRTNGIDASDLPFTKRSAFQDEREFRLVTVRKKALSPVLRIGMPTDTINRVVFGPWMPETVFKNVKKSILQIPKCGNLEVIRTNLTQNKEWQKYAQQAV